MRFFVSAALLGVATTLSACGIGRADGGLFCSTGCSDPKKWRDISCGCVDRPKEAGKKGKSKSSNNTLIADCICDMGDDRYKAWFTRNDSSISDMAKTRKSVKVYSGGCSFLNLCPRTDHGDESFSYSALSAGTINIAIERSGYDGHFGSSYVLGKGSAISEAKPPKSDILRLAQALAALGGGRALEVQFTTNRLNCDLECANSGDCTEFSGNDPLIKSLQKVRQATQNVSTGTIYKTEFLNAFGLAADPCGRDDLHVGSGRFGNVGRPCELSADFNVSGQSVTMKINVPRAVEGQWIYSPTGAEMVFEREKLSPSVTFIGPPAVASNFNGLYSGTIQNVALDDRGARITTDKACLMTRVQ